MKILVVCQFYYPENFTITNIAEGLVKLGHDVTVLTGKPNYGYGYILPEYKNIKYEVINGVKVNRVNLYPRKKSRLSIIRNYLSFYFSSTRWARKCKEEYDVVYSMSLSPVTILAAGNIYKKKHSVKHIAHCVDLWPESVVITHAVRKDSLVYKFLYKWSKDLYSRVDKILIGSPSYKKYFEDVLKIKDKEIKYVPQCALINEVNGSYNYNNDKLNVLYCGNLGLIQQIDLIAPAVSKCSDDIVFHIIGMGPMTNKLLQDIKKYNLENKLIYHGPMPAKKAAPYFVSADALYVSLKNEGTVGKTIPNKVEMYLAFGRPIIAMIEGDGKDVLVDSKGAIFADQNVESLTNALNEFAKLDKDTKEKMSSSNKDYYDNNFSIEVISKKIEKELN